MPRLTEDRLQEAFGSRALLLSSYGGADFGECAETARRVAGGGVDLRHREWRATADALVSDADESAAAGHRVSAREAYLRACTHYRTSYMPLFGTPADEPLRDAFARETAAFAKAVPLWDTPVEPVEIPSENGPTLPGVLALRDDSRRPRATIVHVNGYDSNSHEMFVAHVSAALRRGYNVVGNVCVSCGRGEPVVTGPSGVPGGRATACARCG